MGFKGVQVLSVLCGVVIILVGLAGQEAAQEKPGVLTGKEKLAGKATDEQRVDNCKVPAAKRGSKARPTKCSQKNGAKSAVTQ